jgi:ketosteroid isomerase-like protein
VDLAAEQVRAAEKWLTDAHVHMDIALIERLLHPDYVIIQPGGIVETKDQVLESYRSGIRHWDFAKSDQMDVRVYGEMAVVVGRWQAKGRNGSVVFDYAARFLSVWVKQEGHWQNLTSQSTEIV